jgi:hypothetical protein
LGLEEVAAIREEGRSRQLMMAQSVPERGAVLAEVRAADQDAALAVDYDRLSAERPRDFRELVPKRGKPRYVGEDALVGAVSGKVNNIGRTKTATTAIIAPGTMIQPVRSVRTWAT